VISAFLGGIAALLIKAINALVAALGSVLQGLFDVLPSLPALPSPPDALVTAEGWVAWVFPVSTLVDILSWTLVVWLVWQAVALALRWAKMIGGDS
jgi:hypothetical protein